MDLGNLNAVIANMGKVDNNSNVNGDNSVKTENKSSNGNFKSVMSSKEDSLSKTTEDNKTTVENVSKDINEAIDKTEVIEKIENGTKEEIIEEVMVLLQALNIPVIAAGGIADGRGIAASFMLGAEGVQLGTRFLAAEECQINPVYKELVVKAKDTDSIVTGRYTGHPCRNVKTKFSKKLASGEANGTITPEEFEEITLGSLRKAVQDGNLEEGSFLCGAIAGMVKKVEPAKDMIEEMFTEAEKLLGK